MLITSVKRIEANEEKEIPEHVEVSGAIFNFLIEGNPMISSATTITKASTR